MATKPAKTQKHVEIIARVVFKADPRKVCYLVKSSDGKSQYETCLYDGRVTGCSCPATKPCYHMTQVQQIEAKRTAEVGLEVRKADLVEVDDPWASLDESARRIAFHNMFQPCGLLDY